MKTFTIATAVALLAAFAQAAPTVIQIQIDTGVSTAKITFQGAPADVAYFNEDFPVDGSIKKISVSPDHFHVLLVPILMIDPSFPNSLDTSNISLGEFC